MSDILGPGSTVGILGGGQLGRMLAIAAAQHDGAAPVWLNAANEVAVAAFLDGAVKFLDIAAISPQYWSGLEINIAPTLLQHWRNIQFQCWPTLGQYCVFFSDIAAILPQYWRSIAPISTQYCSNAGIQCWKPILRQHFQKFHIAPILEKHCGNNGKVCWRNIAQRSDFYLGKISTISIRH